MRRILCFFYTICPSNTFLLLCLIAIFTLYSPVNSYAGPKVKFKTEVKARMTPIQYCELYAEEAQRQMKKYGIPASITLAQGMVESGYGASYLANVAKNHFGIKAYRGWDGPVVRADDDKKQEPFCKFKTVEEGYEYHSLFLKRNQRYASLFTLDPTDYEAWAVGLKKAGYATNPKYADMLIRVIEENHLDIYDVTRKGNKKNKNDIVIKHKLFVTSKKHGLKYIRVTADDDLSYIAKEFNVSKRQLRSWNDLHKKAVLMEGDIIYLQPKHKKADKKYTTHIVQPGESLHSISQVYGVTVSSLIKRNKLATATVHQGQVLKLR